jgi:hypothetical protein
MTSVRTRAWVAVGFALGALVGVWNLGRAQSSPQRASLTPLAAPEAAAGPIPTDCKDDAEVAARATRVGAMSKEAEALFLANSQARFLPPKELPARFSGKAIEETLHRSILAAGVDAEILGTDCNEYPCVTTARARSTADVRKIKEQFFDQPTYAADIKQLSPARADDPKELRFGATIYQSTDQRPAELLAAFSRRLGVARVGPGSLRPGIPRFAPDTLGSDR